MWSEQLKLWLGTWEGTYLDLPATWLRFYDSERNLLPLAEEAAEHQIEVERQRAEMAYGRAEVEKQRAEVEKQRAEEERQRAEAAEAELARLRLLLAEKGPAPGAPEQPS
jgi:hypothetical protein